MSHACHQVGPRERGAVREATLNRWARNRFNEHHIYRRSNANDAPTVNNDGSLNYSGVIGDCDYANFNVARTFGVQAKVNF